MRQYKGSRAKFYLRICEKYGETAIDLTSLTSAHKSQVSLSNIATAPSAVGASKAAKSNASTRAPSAVSLATAMQTKEGSSQGSMEEKPVMSRQGSIKQCERCLEKWIGFGSVCDRCRKFGKRGSIQQCTGCSNYF